MTYTFKLARRMAKNHPGYRSLVPLAMFLLAACGSNTPTGASPTPPPSTAVAGFLTLELTTPHSNDGAIQFAVSGPSVDSIRTVGFDGMTTLLNGQAQTIVTGSIGSGVLARVYVADVNRASEYRAWVVAAAARTTYQLQNVSSYRAVLVR